MISLKLLILHLYFVPPGMHWYKLKTTYFLNTFFFFVFLVTLTIHGSFYVDIFQCSEGILGANFVNTTAECQKLTCSKGSWRHVADLNRSNTLNQILLCLGEQTVDYSAFSHFDIQVHKWTGWCLVGIWIALVMRELNQFFWFLWTKKVDQYVNSLQNAVEWAIFLTTLSFFFLRQNYEIGGHLMGWAMLFSWINFTLYLSIFNFIGTRLYMALYVVKQVILSMLVYIPSVIGFSCAFHCFLAGQSTFHSFVMSFLEAMVMMVGETKFEANFSVDKVHEYGGRNVSAQVISNIISISEVCFTIFSDCLFHVSDLWQYHYYESFDCNSCE